ncbi:MAG: chromosomal replication initiator protein DnaA [Chloroflexi bacterium]|nr:chromosomal replication initiator protein DnaA [Chloroflexota bacterium]
MSPQGIWQAVLGELQLSLQRSTYDSWLRDTHAIAYEDGQFIVAVPHAFAQDWLETRLKGPIKQRLQRLCERSVDVRFVVRPNPVAAPDPDVHTTPLLQPQKEEGRFHHRAMHAASLKPAMTFETFIEGDGNRLAYAAAQSVAQDPGTHYNPLFLYGGVGLGKTHLLHAIGHRARSLGFAVRYVTAETFTNDLIEAIRTRSNLAFRQTYREVDVLLIDDIQFIEGKGSTQIEVYNTFNSLYAANKQIVLASDRPPRLLAQLEDRLRSRFMGGLVVDLLPPDLEHRMAILRAKSYEMGLVVSDDALSYIAQRYQSNVRELQGALNRLAAYARLERRPADLALAREALSPEEEILNQDPEAIIQAVADEFRITRSELVGQRRLKRFARPRQVAMYLMREVAQLSFPQIGEYLGGRDHTTVMHGYKKVSQLLADDPELRMRVERVRMRLNREAMVSREPVFASVAQY